MDRLDAARMELFLIQAWTVWNQRNMLEHGEQMKDPCWLNRRAAEYLEDYKKAQDHLAILVATPSGQQLGEVMAGMSAKGPFVRNSEEAEALAC